MKVIRRYSVRVWLTTDKSFFYVYIFFEIVKPNRFQLLFKYSVLLLQYFKTAVRIIRKKKLK